MRIQPVTQEHLIDLRLPEEERWSQVIRTEKATAKTLLRHASETMFGEDTPPMWMQLAMKLLAKAYRFSGGLYRGELKAWSEGMGVPSELLTVLNCQYELSHLGERTHRGLPSWMRRLLRLGCTAGAVKLAENRVVHVRNMDWPLEAMGRATRLVRFTDGDREFVTVGVPGMIGALSGMMPGAYSATINYAPPTFTPGFDFGPLFLLRHVFETCDTYEEACDTLSHTRLSSNVFFLVCSAKGSACVIERTRKDFAKRPMRGGAISVANHYRSRKFEHHNGSWDPGIVEHSADRVQILEGALQSCPSRPSLEKLSLVLEEEHVLNEETRQMMVFDPSRGAVRAWAAV